MVELEGTDTRRSSWSRLTVNDEFNAFEKESLLLLERKNH